MHTDKEYLQCDPFFGDEADLVCHTKAMRTARKDHACYGLTGKRDHTIKPGDRYRHQRALVDGSFWGEYRICIPCMDKFLDGDY